MNLYTGYYRMCESFHSTLSSGVMISAKSKEEARKVLIKYLSSVSKDGDMWDSRTIIIRPCLTIDNADMIFNDVPSEN